MHQVKEKLIKKLKGVRKLCSILSKHSLLVIYKSFVRPNLDYGDVINESFCKKTESLQYQAWLAISGTSSKMLKNWVSSHLNVEGEFGDYVFLLK